MSPVAAPDPRHPYSRAEISALLGGSVRTFLPHRDGVILAGCFSRKLGPHAPREILVGSGPGVERAAELFCAQATPVPVFMEEPQGWMYQGEYRVGHWTADPAVLATYAREGGRDELTRVMFLVRV